MPIPQIFLFQNSLPLLFFWLVWYIGNIHVFTVFILYFRFFLRLILKYLIMKRMKKVAIKIIITILKNNQII